MSNVSRGCHPKFGDPKLVEFYVSNRCSLRCKHCFHGKPVRVDNPVTLEQWLSFADEVYSLGARRFMIGGKEPFSERLTLELADGLKERFADISLGAVCDGFTWQRYANDSRIRLFDFLECSLDGDRAAHDRVRGGGAFDQLMCGLQSARLSLPDSIQSAAMAIGQDNRFALPGAWEAMRACGITNLFVQPMEPVGYATAEMCLSPEDYASLIQAVLDGEARLNGEGSILFYLPFPYRASLPKGAEAHMHDTAMCWLPSAVQRVGILQETVRLPYSEHLIIDSSGALIPHFTLKEQVSRYPERAISVLVDGACQALSRARSRVRDWWQQSGLCEGADGESAASETIFGEAEQLQASVRTKGLYYLERMSRPTGGVK